MKPRSIRSVLLAATAAAAGLAVVAPGGTAEAATVNQTLSCGIGGTNTVGLITEAPATVNTGGTFTVRIGPNGGGKAEGGEIKNMVSTFLAPAGSEVVAGSAVTSGGSGTLGNVTTTVSGQTIQSRVPGPIAKNASYTPPTLTFQLRATGAVGTTLRTVFRQNAAYTLTAGGSFNVSCDASPQATLTSTVIQALPTTTTTTTRPTTTTTRPTTTTTRPTTTTTKPTTTTTKPCTPDVVPFASASALITQQYLDFTGTAPSAGQTSQWLPVLTNCSATPEALIVSLLPADLTTRVDGRLVRLYEAYFKRPPDPSGYAYWKRQLDNGRGLINAARQFAASSEFQRTYGSRTNAQFVDLVYANVLGRSPDPAGRAFWLGRLDRGSSSRGDVMINVSESSENVRRKADHVQVFRLFTRMMGRFPSTAEYQALLAPITTQDEALAGGAKTIRLSAGYAARV